MPGGWEWIVIGAVMLLLFGSRLPQVARSIGDALREFKKGVNDMSSDSGSSSSKSGQAAYSPKPPLTAGGSDERVSRDAEPEPVKAEPEHEPVGEKKSDQA
jgi:sec-independent protein translocase protein TatA